MTSQPHTTSTRLEPDPLWCDAEALRTHVHWLCTTSGLHWRLVAAHAGVSPTAMHHLLFERRGRRRATVHRTIANALAIDVDDLLTAEQRRVPAHSTTSLLRALTKQGWSDQELRQWLTEADLALRDSRRALYCTAACRARVLACYDMLLHTSIRVLCS